MIRQCKVCNDMVEDTLMTNGMCFSCIAKKYNNLAAGALSKEVVI